MATVKEFQKQAENKQRAYQHFIAKGYSPEASAGIVGNLLYESNLNTTVEGDKGYKGGSSFGIAQFRGDRLNRLKSMYGKDWNNFDNQLEFVEWELNNTHKTAGNLLRNAKDVHYAGQVFSDYYEIPAKKYNQNPDRRNKVEQAYQTLVVTPQNQNITPALTELQTPQKTFNFATPTMTPEKIETGVKPAEEMKAEERLEQKQAEKEERPQEVVAQQQMIQPQFQQPQTQQELEILQRYAQVSQFVENPIMQEGGKLYNPNLVKNQEFQQWYNQNTIEGQNNIPYTENLDYDYLSFYMSGDYKNPEFGIENHFPDTYKRTNHETFSNESFYSVPENTGGSWENNRFIKKMRKGGQIPVSSQGVHKYPEQKVLVPTDGSITMKNINYPILGISQETGKKIMMMPNKEYFFENTQNVLEVPQLQNYFTK